ncbi:MAG TPA: hypothetical protein VM490_05855 [Armatimonadaceae bacterium]|nr:hypothetical protein [Armatimonadaceae bacterium]
MRRPNLDARRAALTAATGTALLLSVPAAAVYARQAEPQQTLPPPPATPIPPAGSQQAGPPPAGSVSPVTPGRNLDAPVGPDGKPIVLTPGQSTAVPPREPGTPPGDDPKTLYIESADGLRVSPENQDVVIGEGNVRLRYNGYRVFCDRATFDMQKRVATFESRVEMNTGVQTVYADFVSLNLRTRDFLSRNARTIVMPEVAGPTGLLEPLLLSAETIERKGTDIVATAGFLTTCDFPLPHYRVGFGKATIIPNKRIIVRGATIYQYDRRVIQVGRFEIPIRDEIRYNYLPQVGRTQEEGFFIKNALGYTLGDEFPGVFRLDMMQKKGVGIGADQAYKFGETAAGTILLYGLQDQGRNVSNVNARLNHLQRFGEVDLSISSDLQNNSYLAGQQNSRTQNTTLTATRDIGPSSTTITYNLGGSDYTGSRSRSNAYGITQVQRVRRDFTVTMRYNSTDQDNESLGTDGALLSSSGRQEQTGDLRAAGRLGIFDVDLNANKVFGSRLTGSSGGGGYFSGTERLPELTLATDSQRLGGFLREVPTRFLLGLGYFIENPNNITTGRALFQTDVNPRPFSLTRGGGLSLTFGGGFRQYLYDSTDAAQYILSSSTQLRQRLGRDSSLNFSYNYLRPYGGAPLDFRLDSFGSANSLGANLTVNSYRVRLSLLTGYDIQRAQQDLDPLIPKNPWQNLALQLGLRPSDVFQTRFTASYNINSDRLIDLTNRSRVRAPGGFSLDTSVRYNPDTRKFSQINGALETPLPKDFYLLLLAGYNGTSNRFDYRQIALTKSLHDYEVTFGYIDQPFGGYRAERGFTFSVRLKAFPAAMQNTTGQFGTALDTGLGEVF